MKKRSILFLILIILADLLIFPCSATTLIMDNEIILNIGENKKISKTIEPYEDIIWSIEDDNIATISGTGMVFANEVGTTTITAQAQTVSAVCKIYIKEEMPYVFANDTSGYLYGFLPSCKYNINGDFYTSNENGYISISPDWYGNTISIKKENIIPKCSSDTVNIFINHIHDFCKYKETISPTCIDDGYDLYTCRCNETNKQNIKSKLGHTFYEYSYDKEYHYQKCQRANCDYIRNTALHTFNGDNICIYCEYKKEVEKVTDLCELGHTFDNDCDQICNICGYKRKTEHKYKNSCDATCDICGYIRNVIHTFDNSCDVFCNVCGYKIEPNHTFDNDCDDTCNICGYKRNANHNIQKSFLISDDYHYKKCKNCDAVFDKENHIFDNSCDNTCNICKYKRTIAHTFSENYSYTKRSHFLICTICAKKSKSESHIFDNNKDTNCNVCGYERKINSKTNRKNTIKSKKSNNNIKKSEKESNNSFENKTIETNDSNSEIGRIVYTKSNNLKRIILFIITIASSALIIVIWKKRTRTDK